MFHAPPTRFRGCWPLPWQENVVRAAVGRAEDAAHYWQMALNGGAMVDIHDDQVPRLLPMVYRNLATANPDHEDLGRLGGLYRRTWYLNQRLVANMAPAYQMLNEGGFKPIALKGMALSAGYYDDLGVRPMGDLDVLVPDARYEDAVAFLLANGWTDQGVKAASLVRVLYHGAPLWSPDGDVLDLHFQIGRWLQPDVVDWSALNTVKLAGVSMQVLDPTRQFLHTCCHGLWSGSDATVRWVADALVILRERGDDVDWSLLIELVAGRPTAAVMASACNYLATTFDAAIPADAIEALQQAPISWLQRSQFRMSIVAPWRPVLGKTPLTTAAWVRSRNGQGLRRSARELPVFLSTVWELPSATQLPRAIVSKLGRRVSAPRRGAPAPQPGVND